MIAGIVLPVSRVRSTTDQHKGDQVFLTFQIPSPRHMQDLFYRKAFFFA